MKLWLAAFLVAWGTWPRTAAGCSRLPACVELAPLPSAAVAMTELESSDGLTVARAAFTLARSNTPEQFRALGRALQRTATLNQIMKLESAKRCAIPQILDSLAANPEPEARRQFVALIASRAWAEDPNRADGSDLLDVLLRASGAFRPPTPEVLAMWKRLSAPDDGWVNVTVMALTENGSQAAVRQFEALLRNPKHDLETRIGWLRSDYLAHRDNPLLLNLANRLLDAALPAELKAALVDTTFDPQVESYGICGPPSFPAFSSFSERAREELRALAAKVRARKPDQRLAHAIAKALQECQQK